MRISDSPNANTVIVYTAHSSVMDNYIFNIRSIKYYVIISRDVESTDKKKYNEEHNAKERTKSRIPLWQSSSELVGTLAIS